MRLTKAAIDLKALRHNFNAVRERVGTKAGIMGIVKANAYGHGILEVARTLVASGCEYLAVAFPEEGKILRDGGVSAPVLVLSGAWEEQITDHIAYGLIPTVTTVAVAERFDEAAATTGKGRYPVHLKVDTGMERQGPRWDTALPFIRTVYRFRHLAVDGIYSHFATSEETASPFAREQLDRFQSLLRQMEKEGMEVPHRHIANSGAIINMPEAHENLVRPGIMLYGYAPSRTDPTNAGLQPVLSLRSAVTFLKEVPADTSVSYGRTYYTKSATKIATVPIGYADGYSRRLSNQTEVLIGGRRFPVVGTICMDHMMVDVGGDAGIRAGEEVTIIGRQGRESVTAWDLAARSGTIPYEILTGISERVPRVYQQEG